MSLTDAQIARYERQILLPEVGGRGQECLLRSHVHVQGSGAAADEVATYLAAGGVGALRLDPTFPPDRRAFLETLNPDVRLNTEARVDRVVACGESDDRFVGSQKALEVMLSLLGKSPQKGWSHETRRWLTP